ncbi:unnamed protein product [Arctogadus glacialis]
MVFDILFLWGLGLLRFTLGDTRHPGRTACPPYSPHGTHAVCGGEQVAAAEAMRRDATRLRVVGGGAAGGGGETLLSRVPPDSVYTIIPFSEEGPLPSRYMFSPMLMNQKGSTRAPGPRALLSPGRAACSSLGGWAEAILPPRFHDDDQQPSPAVDRLKFNVAGRHGVQVACELAPRQRGRGDPIKLKAPNDPASLAAGR